MPAAIPGVPSWFWSDPLAPPDGRWQRACCVHQKIRLGRRRRRRSDPDWLPPLLGLADSLNPPARRRHRRRAIVPQDLVAAHGLYESHGPVRWEVEARILAGQTDAEIAASTGLPAEVVDRFQLNFFNVRDRLAAGDFILFAVIGYQPFYGIREGDWRTLWAYFGFAAGPRMLEVVMAVCQGRLLPRWAVESAPSPADVEALIVTTKAAIWALSASLAASSLHQLLLLRLQMLDLEHKRCAKASLRPEMVPGLVRNTGLGDLLVPLDVGTDAESDPNQRELAAVA